MSKSNVGNNEEGGDSAECVGGRIKILNQKERRKWMTGERRHYSQRIIMYKRWLVVVGWSDSSSPIGYLFLVGWNNKIHEGSSEGSAG